MRNFSIQRTLVLPLAIGLLFTSCQRYSSDFGDTNLNPAATTPFSLLCLPMCRQVSAAMVLKPVVVFIASTFLRRSTPTCLSTHYHSCLLRESTPGRYTICKTSSIPTPATT